RVDRHPRDQGPLGEPARGIDTGDSPRAGISWLAVIGRCAAATGPPGGGANPTTPSNLYPPTREPDRAPPRPRAKAPPRPRAKSPPRRRTSKSGECEALAPTTRGGSTSRWAPERPARRRRPTAVPERVSMQFVTVTVTCCRVRRSLEWMHCGPLGGRQCKLFAPRTLQRRMPTPENR